VKRGGWNWLRVVSNDVPCFSTVEPSGSAIRQLIGKTS